MSNPFELGDLFLQAAGGTRRNQSRPSNGGGAWRGDDDGEDDGRRSGGEDSDSAPSFGSDLYKDEEDKEQLEMMSELNREMILAERSSRIHHYKLKQKQKQMAQGEVVYESDFTTPSTASGKRPARPVQEEGKKHKTESALIVEAVTSIASLANEYASKREGKFSIVQVMEAVLACGAGYDTDEHYIATQLFVKKEQREMFMTLPTDEIRFKWLTRKYNDKYAN